MSLTFTIDPEEPEVAYVRDAAGRQLAQINLFGVTSTVMAAACHTIPNGGSRVTVADQP